MSDKSRPDLVVGTLRAKCSPGVLKNKSYMYTRLYKNQSNGSKFEIT